METSKISWTDSTFNPWIGCTHVSPGCKLCYAESLMDTRYQRVKWGKGQPRDRTGAATWAEVKAWNKTPYGQTTIDGEVIRGTVKSLHLRYPAADIEHVRRRVFCASLCDVFDPEAPAEWRKDLFDLIDACPNLNWLLLTKRPELIEPLLAEMSHDAYGEAWDLTHMPQIRIGTTIESQAQAYRLAVLSQIPAAGRFISCEPLIGPLELPLDDLLHFPDWVIVGGESGHYLQPVRPMNPEWARALRDQCNAYGITFHFKQWGNFAPGNPVWQPKHVIPALLDGVPHLNFPANF